MTDLQGEREPANANPLHQDTDVGLSHRDSEAGSVTRLQVVKVSTAEMNEKL